MDQVSEVRFAPYLHDRHRADHAVRDYCWRRAMTGADHQVVHRGRGGRWRRWARAHPATPWYRSGSRARSLP